MRAPSLALFLLAASFAVPALPAAASECDADKLLGLSRAATDFVKCRARDAITADTDVACTSGIAGELAAAFTAAEGGDGCSSTGEYSEVQEALDLFGVELGDLLLTTSMKDGCAASKLKAAGKRLKKELACRRSAAKADEMVDVACVAPWVTKMVEHFTKRDASGKCNTSGDSEDTEQLISDFLGFVSLKIAGTTGADAPSDLQAALNGGDVELSWVAPNPASGLTQMKLLRRLNAVPSSPVDPSAETIYTGPAITATDDLTDLLPTTTATPRVYYYRVFGCDMAANCETTGSSTTFSATVVQALRAGGYVLHWRHASADVCADQLSLGTAETTSSPDWWKTCDTNCGTSTARQLNATGHTEAETIGDSFVTLGIPVGRVISSEFCRNVQTAEGMDFGPTIELSQELTYYVYDEANRCNDTFVMLAEAPAAGTNTALIGHAGNSCAPLSNLAWGEAAIYKPDGIGGSIYIDRVLANSWLTLP